MGNSVYKSALASTEAALDDAERAVSFFHLGNELRPQLVDLISYQNLNNAQLTRKINKFIHMRDLRPEILYSSVYSRICGLLEDFIRETLKITGSVLHERKKTDLKITNDWRASILELGIQAVKSRHTPQDHISIDLNEVLAGLGSLQDTVETLSLSPSTVQFAYSGIRQHQVTESFKIFGISLNWDEVSGGELSRILGTRKARDTKKELENWILQMVRRRNRIAHSGSAADVIAYEIVIEQIAVVRALVSLLSTALEKQLTKALK